MKYLCYDTALNEEYTLIQLIKRYPQYMSLFQGTDDERIWDAAPYLFPVKDDFYKLRAASSLICLDHCVVFETNEKMIDTVQFLQSFFYSRKEATPVYFRIWDARILCSSFKNWDVKEQLKFFEFFTCFYTEHEEGDHFNKWVFGRNDLIADKVLKSNILPNAAPEDDAEEELQYPGTVLEKPGAGVAVTEEPPAKSETEIATPKRRRFFIE